MTLVILGLRENVLAYFDTVFTRHLVAFDRGIRRPEVWIFSAQPGNRIFSSLSLVDLRVGPTLEDCS